MGRRHHGPLASTSGTGREVLDGASPKPSNGVDGIGIKSPVEAAQFARAHFPRAGGEDHLKVLIEGSENNKDKKRQKNLPSSGLAPPKEGKILEGKVPVKRKAGASPKTKQAGEELRVHKCQFCFLPGHTNAACAA